MIGIFHKLKFLETFLTIVAIFGITTALFLYTSGYRLSKGTADKPMDINKTGMVSAKSIPEGASVYLDGVLTTATNDTISGIKPGIHNLKIVKKGFMEWNKDIEVYEQLVTDITAVLVSQSPRLEPLTNTGASGPSISHSLSKLAYFSTDDDKPGIWIIPLSGNGLNLFKTNASVAIQDTKYTKYSLGKAIEWSPDEKQLLVEGQNGSYYLVDLDTNTAETTTSAKQTRQGWETILIKKRTDAISKIDLPENIRLLAVSSKTMWAPDDKKFLYTVQNGDKLEYRVYNMEKPIPVGEKPENLSFVTNVSDQQPKISWYSDSFHIVMVEGNVKETHTGIISLIRIDGTNKVEIYNNTLYSDLVYSVPGGDKFIILTTFKSGGDTNLYTIAIR